MKAIVYKIASISLISACVIGILFSLVGIGFTWYMKPRLTAQIQAGLFSLTSALEITNQGLNLAETALVKTTASLGALQSAIETTADTVDATSPAMDSLVRLTDVNLPGAVEAAQASLQTAQQGAEVIDGVLSALNMIPGVNYNPEVPLSSALENVAKSMDDLPNSFFNMKAGLIQTRDNLDDIQQGIRNMATNIADIKASLEGTQKVIDGYQAMADSMLQKADALSSDLSIWMALIAVLFTVFFLWLAFIQLGLLLLGWELFQKAGNGK